MNQIRPGGFSILPPVVKNLLIINGLFFLAQIVIDNSFKVDINEVMGLYYMGSEKFHPYQFITYMFLHANFTHLFFNMFALWMFGNTVENVWGPRKFMIYYFVTGIGAALLHQFVQFVQIGIIEQQLYDAGLTILEMKEILITGKYSTGILNTISEQTLLNYWATYNVPTVGASGAIFGLLLAFGMLFPNAVIYLYFAIPIKAKWFVIIYGAVELFFGVMNQAGDNVAHFAHLGGMIFGFVLIKYWHKGSRFF